jgi:hypothetical protein
MPNSMGTLRLHLASLFLSFSLSLSFPVSERNFVFLV